MDEILDIRRDASAALGTYRRTVASLAREIETWPWGPAMESAVRDVWIRRVQPAMDEIADHFSQASFLRQLGPQVREPADLLAKGAIAFAAGSASTRSVVVSSILGSAVAFADAVGKARAATRRERAAATGSGLYLLHVVASHIALE